MENLLVVVVIIYFVANVFGRSTKKRSANQDKYSIEPSENDESSLNMELQKYEDGYFSEIEEYFGVKAEEKNTEEAVLAKMPKEKNLEHLENLDNKMQNIGDTYNEQVIIEKKKPKKKLNISKKALKNAVIMSEILGKPVSMK